MSRALTTTLRIALAFVALGTLVAQFIVVASTAESLRTGHPALPGVVHSVAAVFTVACIQVCLVAIWALLTRVRRDTIFDERSFRWVPVMAVAGVAGAVSLAAVCAHVGELDDAPGLVLIGGGIGVAGIAFALLMTVMLDLLRQATVLRRRLGQTA